MPTFDVVSELDMQEVRNAVDQASREVATRYDFKNTGTTIELKDKEIELNTESEARLTALKQVLEEKMVKRQVPLKGLSYGEVTPAAGSTVRQEVSLQPDLSNSSVYGRGARTSIILITGELRGVSGSNR